MKKLILIALVLGLACMFAAPAAATDFSAKGYMWVRGTASTHVDLRDNASRSDMSMKWRIEPEFKVSDNLKLNMRIDALDNKDWGDADLNSGRDADNVDFDRAWMTISTDFGQFRVGRQAGNIWGTTFADSVGERDSIIYLLPMGNWTFAGRFDKRVEADDNDTVSDADMDQYYLTATYKHENFTTGLLLSFIDNQTVATTDTVILQIVPYIDAKFGDFYFKGEFLLADGDMETDAGVTTDVEAFGFFAELGGKFGAFGAHIGAAYATGDANATDGKMESAGALQAGGDWANFFFFTNNDSGVAIFGTASGFLVEGGGTVGNPAYQGFQLLYAGVDYALMDNVTLSGILGYADADETPAGTDDEYGTEFDVKLTWVPYDNLDLQIIGAYLAAGDFFKGGVANVEVEDNFTVFSQLRLKY